MVENKRIENTDQNRFKRIKMLVYGEQGEGKTYATKTMNNVCLFNLDGKGKEYDTPTVEIKNYDELANAVDWFVKNFQKQGFEILVIDTVDKIWDFAEDKVRGNFATAEEAKGGYGKGTATVKAWFKKATDILMKLPIIVIFNSWEIKSSYADDNGKERTEITHNLNKKVAVEFLGSLDLVGRITKEKVRTTQGDAEFRLLQVERFGLIQSVKHGGFTDLNKYFVKDNKLWYNWNPNIEKGIYNALKESRK